MQLILLSDEEREFLAKYDWCRVDGKGPVLTKLAREQHARNTDNYLIADFLARLEEAETVANQLLQSHGLAHDRIEVPDQTWCPRCGAPVLERDSHYVPSVGHDTDPDDAIEPYWTCELRSGRWPE